MKFPSVKNSIIIKIFLDIFLIFFIGFIYYKFYYNVRLLDDIEKDKILKSIVIIISGSILSKLTGYYEFFELPIGWENSFN